MLRFNRLSVSTGVRALRSITARTPVNTTLAVRFQTTASTSTESQSQPQQKTPKAKKVIDYKKRANELLLPIDELFASKASSKEIFNRFVRLLSESRVVDTQEYSKRAFNLLKLASQDAHANVEGTIPPTLEEIVTILTKHKLLYFTHVSFVMSELIREGDYLGALNQATSYRQYVIGQGQKFESTDIKNFTVVSYLLYTKDAGKPSKEQIMQLTNATFLPKQDIITKTINRLRLSEPVKRTAIKQAELLYLSDKNPNAISDIKKAMESAKLGNTDRVTKGLEQARKYAKLNNKKLSVDTLLAYMKMFNLLRNGEASLRLWNELIESGIQPSIHGWNLLLEAVSCSGPSSQRIAKVDLVLKELEAAGVKRNDETTATLIRIYTTLNERKLIEELATAETLQKSPEVTLAHLEWLSKSGKFDEVSQVLLDLKKQGAGLTNETYNKLLYNFAIKAHYRSAELLLKEMDAFKVKPDVATYTIVLDCTFKLYKKAGLTPSETFLSDFFKDMKQHDIQPNEFTLTSIITALAREPVFIPTAEFLFDYLRETKRASKVSYVSLISSEFKAGNTEKAEQYLQSYIDSGFELKDSNWSMIFQGFQINKDVAKTKEYLKKLVATGRFEQLFNKYSLYFILRLADTTKDQQLITEVFDLLEVHKFKDVSPQSVEIIQKLQRSQVIPVSEYIQTLISKKL